MSFVLVLWVEKKSSVKIIIIIMDPEYKIVYRFGDNTDTKFRLS